MTDTVVILTSGSSWTVPADFSGANKVEMIGGGAAGGATVGGAGADYAKTTNIALTPGANVSYQIGSAGTSGGNGGDTWFDSTTTVQAKGGGSSSSSVGSTTYAGGTGNAAGGGGGAAGPSGAGGNAPSATGGTGDNGTVPADTSGTEWGTVGSGGGGSVSSALPNVIQQIPNTYNSSSGTSDTTVLPSAPTAGNVLLLTAASLSSSDIATPPTGFTLVGSQTVGTYKVYWYQKTSDGTETTTTTTWSISSRHCTIMQEWPAGTTFGTMTIGSLTGLTTSASLGPSDAPSGSGVPSMLAFCDAAGFTTATWPAGWTNVSTTGGGSFPYGTVSVGVGAGTSSAANPTITFPARPTAMCWANIWVY